MVEGKQKQIRAIELVRNLFEAIHGNLKIFQSIRIVGDWLCYYILCW
jgi:hypothetical protein